MMEKEEPLTWNEGCQLRTYELSQQGWTQQKIAEAFGVSAGVVRKWTRRAREGRRLYAINHRLEQPAKLTTAQLAP